MSPEDNVIPFPFPDLPEKPAPTRARPPAEGDAKGDGPEEPLTPAVLADLLWQRAQETGSNPMELLAALTQEILDADGPLGTDPAGGAFGLGSPFGGFTRRTPSLLEPRDDVATYRIRVDLDDVKPPIWRRLDVPSDLTLDRLHEVLQVAMGWTGSHLHAFRMGPDRKDWQMAAFATEYDLAEGMGEDEPTTPLECDVRLDQVLQTPGQRLFYEYDFGDGWDHTLKLEKVLEAGAGGCVAGRRACPPEDCGGVPGYEDLVAALGGDQERLAPFDSMDELREWLPLGWAPEAFDLSETDADVTTVLAGGTPGLPPTEALNPVLADLLEAAAGTPARDALAALTIAALADTPYGPLGEAAQGGLDPAVIAETVRPLQVLLDVVREHGELTGAGYLKPAAVSAIAEGLRLQDRWSGKASREDLTPPVAHLRAAAQHLGLVRRQGANLHVTSAADGAGDDPRALWELVVRRLPVGTPAQRQVGILLLLTTAGGLPPRESGGVLMRVLQDVGWRGGRFTHAQTDAALTPTWEVLAALGCFDSFAGTAVADLGMDLATAALLRS